MRSIEWEREPEEQNFLFQGESRVMNPDLPEPDKGDDPEPAQTEVETSSSETLADFCWGPGAADQAERKPED